MAFIFKLLVVKKFKFNEIELLSKFMRNSRSINSGQ